MKREKKWGNAKRPLRQRNKPHVHFLEISIYLIHQPEVSASQCALVCEI